MKDTKYMKKDYSGLGERIRSERKQKKWSQEKLIEQLDNIGVQVGRNTLSKLESGDMTKEVPLKLLLGLCDLFGCEIGYLLREKGYEYSHTRETADIGSVTGLSEPAIKQLIEYHIGGLIEKSNPIGETLSFLLEPPHCKQNSGGLLHLITAYIHSNDFSVSGLSPSMEYFHTDGKNGSGFNLQTADVVRAAIPNMIMQRLEEYRHEILHSRK